MNVKYDFGQLIKAAKEHPQIAAKLAQEICAQLGY